MAADQNPDEKIADLTKQVQILTQQLALVNAQRDLDAAKQTQETKLNQAVIDALKSQATSQFNLESEQAKLPFAELAGVKAALGGAQLPAGKQGTVMVAAGTTGAALLRSKGPMLKLLNEIAVKLKEQLPEGAVIVTEAQMDQAYQASFTETRIAAQTRHLDAAISAGTPPTQTKALTMALPAFAAAAYSLGFVLDTVNSLGKLFRVDRKADIFAADEEARQMLGYLLEGGGGKFVANPALVRAEVLVQAESLLAKLDQLLAAIHRGDDLLAQWKKIEEDEAKTKPATSQLPAANVASELKAQMESARSLLDGLHPSKKPDAFWTQVKGQSLWQALKGRDLLLLEVKGQAVQITESRWWRSDRLMLCGEIQVAYRILGKDGKLKNSGVILRASKMEKTSFKELSDYSFP
jgi:hypothetical protein